MPLTHIDANTGTRATTYNLLARYITDTVYNNVGRVLCWPMILEHVKKLSAMRLWRPMDASSRPVGLPEHR